MSDFAALGLPDPLRAIDGSVWVLPDGQEVQLIAENFRVEDLPAVHLSEEQAVAVALALLDAVLIGFDQILAHAAINATAWRKESNAEQAADAAGDAASWRDEGEAPR